MGSVQPRAGMTPYVRFGNTPVLTLSVLILIYCLAEARNNPSLKTLRQIVCKVKNSRTMLTFQEIILKLQQYWSNQGCTILQPVDLEVGAGTSHTATFLRAIGPEPWKAAYVQPSRRPKDGRYGENPNRLQHYYQFQVVLKPSPENILRFIFGLTGSSGS
jgi:hypothetical protein